MQAADIETNTRGRSSIWVSAVARVCVVPTRLWYRVCLYAALPRWPRTSAPARFTTASTPSRAGSSTCAVAGFQKPSSADRGGRRTSRTTRWPLDVREPQSAVPIIPLAPRTATRMSPPCPRAPASHPQVALELPTFEPLLDRREESGGIRAVDEPVVVGQREVRHRADRDAVGAGLVGGDDGDAEVLGIEVGDLALVGVDRGVDVRVCLERLDRGLGEERQERQLDALTCFEAGLRPLAQSGDRGHVDLDDGRELCRDLQ